MDKNYNVDDILSEIKSRKSREKGGIPAQTPPQPQQRPPLTEAEHSAREPVAESPRFHLQPDESMSARHNPLDFSGHVRPITDKARMRPGKLPQRPEPEVRSFEFLPPEMPEELPLSEDAEDKVTRFPGGQTQALDFSAFRSEPDAGQRTRVLPHFNGARDTDPPARVQAAADGYFDEDEYSENEPAHAAVDFSEYNSVKDRRDVATDIARVKLWLFLRTAVTFLLTAVIFYLSYAGKYVMPLPAFFMPEGETTRTYFIALTALTALTALINSSSVGGGLISLFKLRANSDTLATLALLSVIAQGVAAVAGQESADPTLLNLYFPSAALAMLAGALGKMSMINRIQSNFRVLAADKPKKALMRVQDDRFCREFLPGATRKPTIAYSVRASFFTDFLGLSYSDKYDVGINRAVAPACLAGAIVVAVACYLLTGSSREAVAALTAILCVCASLSATFIENIPLGKLTKKLAPDGCMVTGNKAVEDFCDTEALILTEKDLFPTGGVRLRGIKTFSQARIDEAILDAASVICSLEGAQAPVFLQMIGGNRALLKKVDNVVYENGMGISAWVDSRRVLIGNLRLMQNHGIVLPPEAHAAAQQAEGDLLYLSSSGEAAAQFALSYHIDEELAAQLDQLAARNTVLILHTTDANLTVRRVWELYGYPEELIRILPAERHAEYREMTKPRENAVAEIVYTGRASSLAASIVACFNARGSILWATILELVQIVLGYGLIAFMASMGSIGALTVTQLCAYQLFWFVVIFILQQAKQP